MTKIHKLITFHFTSIFLSLILIKLYTQLTQLFFSLFSYVFLHSSDIHLLFFTIFFFLIFVLLLLHYIHHMPYAFCLILEIKMK
jgi:hypothetical protein